MAVAIVVSKTPAAVARGSGEDKGEGSAVVRMRAVARAVVVAVVVGGNSNGGGENTTIN